MNKKLIPIIQNTQKIVYSNDSYLEFLDATLQDEGVQKTQLDIKPPMVQEFLKNSWANMADQDEDQDNEGFTVVTLRKRIGSKLLKTNLPLESLVVLIILPLWS